MSAEERREEILEAAMIEFARKGLHGTSTETIAERVGISQPYLFRLFPTKKDLFLAASEKNMNDTLGLLRDAAGGKTGHDALEAMGLAYQEKLTTHREWLLMQLQTFAACYDEDVQRQTRHCLQEIWDGVETLSGLPIEDRVVFFAKGMFCNVIAVGFPLG